MSDVEDDEIPEEHITDPLYGDESQTVDPFYEDEDDG